ncbi:ammonium transporter AmtB-like domain-containing protein [Chytriomyces sp. MP71]|nr:ammonium transporter AmtB-like domain-containing protein [Chytriomyces sp. MP71]
MEAVAFFGLIAARVMAQTQSGVEHRTNTTNTTHAVSPLDSGDVAWLLVAAALIFTMTPGLGFFYSGLAETKNSLSMLHVCMLIFSVVAVQWSLFGYSISFSDTSSSVFIGNLRYAALLDTMDTQNKVAPTVPNSLWAMYQMMAACITPGLWIGATAGRMRILPTMVLALIWTTIVYDPIAYWVYGHNGWLHNLNVLDYAGGTLVHLSAGSTAFVLAAIMGRRVDYGQRDYENHNPSYVYLGTALLWFGWMGFDGGCATSANSRAVNAAFTTNLSGAVAGLIWMGLDTVVNKKRFSAIGYCTGAIAGLATMTAGSGLVQPGFGLIYGLCAGVFCFFGVQVMHFLRIDDSLDVAAVHGVGGSLGLLLTGVFAQYKVTATDIGSEVAVTAGWVDRVWIQVPVQLAAIAAVAAWSMLWTALLVSVMNKIPILRLRVSAEEEVRGIDATEVGEQSYHFVALPTREEIIMSKCECFMTETSNEILE